MNHLARTLNSLIQLIYMRLSRISACVKLAVLIRNQLALKSSISKRIVMRLSTKVNELVKKIEANRLIEKSVFG
jgi:hypothetical protein